MDSRIEVKPLCAPGIKHSTPIQYSRADLRNHDHLTYPRKDSVMAIEKAVPGKTLPLW